MRAIRIAEVCASCRPSGGRIGFQADGRAVTIPIHGGREIGGGSGFRQNRARLLPPNVIQKLIPSLQTPTTLVPIDAVADHRQVGGLPQRDQTAAEVGYENAHAVEGRL